MENLKKLNTFIAFDFETATSSFTSACSIGIVKFEGGKIVDTAYYLIQPPANYYAKYNIEVHGITPEDTKNEPFFPEIWEKIKYFFDNTLVCAHNAFFDTTVLKTMLEHYKLEIPQFSYFDTMHLGGQFIAENEKVSKSLNSLCEHFKLPEFAHHNALADATACGGIALFALENSKFATLGEMVLALTPVKKFADIEPKHYLKTYKKFDSVPAREIMKKYKATDKINPNFQGKTFVITSQLKHLTREQAYIKIVEGGGFVKDNVSKKVDYLVSGNLRVSTKLRTAIELQSKNHHIKIIREEDFLNMLK